MINLQSKSKGKSQLLAIAFPTPPYCQTWVLFSGSYVKENQVLSVQSAPPEGRRGLRILKQNPAPRSGLSSIPLLARAHSLFLATADRKELAAPPLCFSISL